ncbi:transcription elongation factor [Dyadobacter psychrotolerans]|uniref:Transcription elongation factor n=1 Tax=Dyadobacter psychrotolerans TaxID=2541721 RepID=A0A4R5E250_9BACT|nr:transcription elongation factor [Dyadobacter psychrotolerans]TDE18325.1 transcription elongation factor [Dyadobacter psychrotolerans]
MNKTGLIAYMKDLLDERMQVAWTAMEAAQESANDQSKSSMGDKYETSRSMGQLDRNMHAKQYEQIRLEKTVLERIAGNISSSRGAIGSLVHTTAGWFFVSVSLGILKFEDETVIAVSSSSPVGTSLLGKVKGDQFRFQNKEQKILHVE